MGIKEEINNIIDHWDDDYNEYKAKAEGIIEQTNRIIEGINGDINTINELKMRLNDSSLIIYNFLKKFGNPEEAVSLVRYKAESTFTPVLPKLEENGKPPKTDYNKFGQRKDNKVKLVKLKEDKKFAWDNDIEKKESEKHSYEQCAKIVQLYRMVFSSIEDTIERIVLPELPGIESYLYARGVKDAILSGDKLSTAKPEKITRLKNSHSEGIKMHYRFFVNTHDLYTLIGVMFTTDVLGDIFKNSKMVQRHIEQWKAKEETLSTNLNDNAFYSLEE